VARLARAAADWTREHNGAELVGRVKRAALLQKVLYRPLDERPRVLPEDVALIRSALSDEIARVEERFDVTLRARWGWSL
jgi:hypothetical protein